MTNEAGTTTLVSFTSFFPQFKNGVKTKTSRPQTTPSLTFSSLFKMNSFVSKIFALFLLLAGTQAALPDRALRKKKKKKASTPSSAKSGKGKSAALAEYCIVKQPFTCAGVFPTPDCTITVSCMSCGGMYYAISAVVADSDPTISDFSYSFNMNSVDFGIEGSGTGGTVTGNAMLTCVLSMPTTVTLPPVTVGGP